MRIEPIALIVLSLPLSLTAFAQTQPAPWTMQSSGTTASLRGIHALPGGIAWASGSDGTVLRTEDGGYLWQKCAIPKGAEKLDFRGIWAWDANTAMVMSSGPGDQSRIYKTTDGCKTWSLKYTNPDAKGFWDAIGFLEPPYRPQSHGTILGDPVNGAFRLFESQDQGETWTPEVNCGLEADPKKQGAFAASNTALAMSGDWFGTGGVGGAHIFQINSTKRTAGESCPWPYESIPVPMAGGSEGAGIFSVSDRSTYQQGGIVGYEQIAVGGDYRKPNETKGTAASSGNDGKGWTAATVPPHGYRSAVAWDKTDRVWVCAGTNGSDYSRDDGKTWHPLDDGNWNALSLPYAVGPKGRIAKLADGSIPTK